MNGRQRTIVIVTPYFPPSNLAGVHRARHLAKHLPAHGWQPIVLTVDPSYYEESGDPLLASLVPDKLRMIRVPAVPARLARLFGIGDVGIRAWRQLRAELLRLAQEPTTEAVLITGGPFYPLLLSKAVKRTRRLPVILDFQDPWVSNWGKEQSILSKAGISHGLASWLEPRALRHADFVTSVSDRQNAEMRDRYPWLRPEQMAGIPIGGDPEDFEALRNSSSRSLLLSREKLNFSYVGTCLPKMEITLRVLFRAFRRLRGTKPELADRMIFNFIGTSNQPNDFSTYRVMAIAQEEGIAEAIKEVPQRIPYLDALSAVANSDAVLLLGSDEPHYTGSKIFAGLMSGVPFLSLFHRESSSHQTLARAGGGTSLCFGNLEELDQLEIPLAMTLATLAEKPASLGRVDPDAFQDATAHAIAGRYANILERLTLSEDIEAAKPSRETKPC